mmetsp:Transcript_17103/g.25779  ORF Transcript_17103/g.25779 Transcript_17103/m.25779 type:complete len:538 (-) Transcript_17103:119-1732(-)
MDSKTPNNSTSMSMNMNTPLDHRYRIHLSGLCILLAILTSASIALFSGRIVASYKDNVSSLPLHQQRQRKVQLPIIPQSDIAVPKDEATATVGNKVNYEALVHPSMITHPNPKKVMIIESREKDATRATKREVLKHTSVQEVVIVEHDEVAGCSKEGERLFDVIIVPALVKDVTDVGLRAHVSTMFNCLEDEGILALNFEQTITHKGPDLGYFEVINELEHVGYESMHQYEDESNDFGTRHSFLVALKSHASRADWYINEAEILIRLRQRINSSDLNFFDAPTMLQYQIPSKAVESAYCRRGDDARKEECEERSGLSPQLSNTPVSDLSVGKSTVGEYSGRGLFAAKDIQEGGSIGLEKKSLSYFILPSTHQIIEEMYYWAEENYDEAYASEVYDSISAVEAFSIGYGFWSTLLGRTHSTVDSGALMFCNHGCNGTYNYGVITGFTEANVDLKQPAEMIIGKSSAFSPVTERNMRQYLSGGDATNRVIKQGEELLCDYLGYVGNPQYWEEEIVSLRGQCDGSEAGDITYFESRSSEE